MVIITCAGQSISRISHKLEDHNQLYLFDLHEAFQLENTGKWSFSATGPSSAPSQIAKEIVPSSVTTPTRQSSAQTGEEPKRKSTWTNVKGTGLTTLIYHRSLLIVTHRLSWPSKKKKKEYWKLTSKQLQSSETHYKMPMGHIWVCVGVFFYQKSPTCREERP